MGEREISFRAGPYQTSTTAHETLDIKAEDLFDEIDSSQRACTCEA